MIQATPKRIHIANARPTVCHVVHALGVGGAEVLVDRMVRCMSDEFRCVVAVLDEVGELGEQLQRDGFVVEHLHRRPGIDHGCARRLKAFADREGADLLHAHQYTPFFQSMLSRGIMGSRPVVFTEHGRHVPDLPSRKRTFVNRMLLRGRDRIIGCGAAVRNALIQNEGLPANRVEFIYNGVDLDAIAKPSPGARSRIRREFNLEEMDYVVVLVARLHELKDHQTALKAIDLARMQIPRLRLIIVGEGEQQATIEKAIHELDLYVNVRLAGKRHDVADLLAASDVFLMSSISEGIPLTIIEAMAAERPVVATAVGGIPEVIEHGVSGLLSPAKDDNALAKHLIELYRRPELGGRLACAAAIRASRLFSLEGMLNSYRDVYREVLQGRAAKSLRPSPRIRLQEVHS